MEDSDRLRRIHQTLDNIYRVLVIALKKDDETGQIQKVYEDTKRTV